MIEVMLVVVVIGGLLGTAVPSLVRTREGSQREACGANLRQIDAAKEQCALETALPNKAIITLNTLVQNGYVRASLQCPTGGTYQANPVGAGPSCSHCGTSPSDSGYTVSVTEQDN